jgi:DNA-binding transcriptional regulator YdaS (Cro superfamily)
VKQAGSDQVKLDGPSAVDQMKKIFSKVKGNTAMRIERALKKMDERKLKRLKRRNEWEELHKSKLPDNYENPQDLASIRHAEETIGDFKLKSSKDFVVPEKLRMNVFKAVDRLMQIKKFVSLILAKVV